jgi:hypothetical protein
MEETIANQQNKMELNVVIWIRIHKISEGDNKVNRTNIRY